MPNPHVGVRVPSLNHLPPLTTLEGEPIDLVHVLGLFDLQQQVLDRHRSQTLEGATRVPEAFFEEPRGAADEGFFSER